MPLQLLPFQKVVDMPVVTQRHQRAICELAITSIVLISLILCLFIQVLLSNNAVLFFIFGIPSMILVFLIVLISNVISLHNIVKWASTDVCCNVMRSQPTCCTKSCGGNKHCCARLSCAHTASSVFISLICVLFVVLVFTGCGESTYHGHDDLHQHDANYHHEYVRGNYRNDDANYRYAGAGKCISREHFHRKLNDYNKTAGSTRPTRPTRGGGQQCQDTEGETDISINGRPATCEQLAPYRTYAQLEKQISKRCPKTCGACEDEGTTSESVSSANNTANDL